MGRYSVDNILNGGSRQPGVVVFNQERDVSGTGLDLNCWRIGARMNAPDTVVIHAGVRYL